MNKKKKCRNCKKTFLAEWHNVGEGFYSIQCKKCQIEWNRKFQKDLFN